MDKIRRPKSKRRITLAFKLNLTTVLILLAFVAAVMLVNYTVERQRIQDEYFAVANKAAQELSDYGTGSIMSDFREFIESEEFIEVRERARTAGSETMLTDWMKKKSFDEESANNADNDPDGYFMSAYNFYDLICTLATRILVNYDISSCTYVYMKEGQAYYLGFTPNGTLDLGMPAPGIEYDGQDRANGFAPARIYSNDGNPICRAMVTLHKTMLPDEEPGEDVYADNADEIYGVAVVDINIQFIQNASRSLLRNTIFITILLTAASIALNIFLVRRFAVRPLKALSDATCRFGKDKETYSLDDVIDVDIRSNDEIRDLYQEIRAMQGRIVDYTGDLERLTAEKTRAATELQLAANIQGSMLKSSDTAFPGQRLFEIAASMDPAREVGGDFYDFFLIDEDHLALIIADVSGKGIPAALFMMSAMLLLKSHTEQGKTPSAVLSDVNNEICENNEAEMFVTVWMGILDLKTGNMKCANAGHEYPVIRGSDSEFKYYKDKHGLVIGAMGGIPYREYELNLEPGNIIFVYTDGLPEASNGNGEFYGFERIISVLNAGGSSAPADILQAVASDVDSFVAGAQQFDDLTMLCVKYNGAG